MPATLDRKFVDLLHQPLQVLERGDGKSDGAALVDAWIKRDDAPLKFTLAMFADMRAQVNMDYPTVSVAVRRLAQLVQAGARS